MPVMPANRGDGEFIKDAQVQMHSPTLCSVRNQELELAKSSALLRDGHMLVAFAFVVSCTAMHRTNRRLNTQFRP